MTTTRIDDTPYRIQNVLQCGPASFRQIILAAEFNGPVGGSIPRSLILAALADLIDAGTVAVANRLADEPTGDVTFRLARHLS